MPDITQLLNTIEPDDQDGLDRLLLSVYGDLQRLARRKMAHESGSHTLSATALVHEAYLRLVRSPAQKWDHRGHFFGAAAEAMRRILIESARRKLRLKHGGHVERTQQSLDELPITERVEELLALDDALQVLAAQHPQAAQLVKLRYFAGLSLEQTAESLGISERTAKRIWAYARAWLYAKMYP
jgi:RNA polymerase sigma factor (TIGR02999 family)